MPDFGLAEKSNTDPLISNAHENEAFDTHLYGDEKLHF